MHDKIPSTLTVWGVTSGNMGMRSQVTALADNLGFAVQHKVCERRKPWAWLPSLFSFGALHQKTKQSDDLSAPFPDVLITCGRRSIPFALEIKRLSLGKTFCLHIQNPHISPRRFDLVMAPEHDHLRGCNVMCYRGSLHAITPQSLSRDAQVWYDYMAPYPRPYYGILLGGSTHHFKMTPQVTDHLLNQIDGIAAQTKGTIFIMLSGRTGADNAQKIISHYRDNPSICVPDLAQDNPYKGVLALSDILFVTNDSVNMMNEAGATMKPVYVLPLFGLQKGKPIDFMNTMIQAQRMRLFQGLVETWTPPAHSDDKDFYGRVLQKITSFLANR